MRHLAPLVLLAACAASAAQTPPKPAPKGPQVPGYKTHVIEGFTVLVHEDVLKVPAGTYERPPLEVLERELKTIVKVVNPKSADALRRLLIWAEWDDRQEMGNGRDGSALAVYRGGHQASLLKQGTHPLKSKTVDILRMKSLTEEHQPKRDSGRCVLLHEFAHAVHDQLLGNDNPQIKAAFQKAMERKLYDKGQYVATNPQEFFAELTCCYLDKLHYFPNTRDDLKAHDPDTFKLMAALWAGASPNATAKTPGKAPAAPGDGSDKFSLSVRFPESVRFGEVVLGGVAAADTKGKVVVLAYWGGNNANVLDRLNKLHDELKDYGVAVIAAYPFVKDPAEIKAEAERRGAGYAVTRSAFLKDGDGNPKNADPPHALVFDPSGACVFRGTAHAADTFARAAVGRGMLATLGRDDLPKGLKAAADLLAAGSPFPAVAAKLAPLTTSSDADTKAAAKALYDLVTAPAQARLAAAQDGAKADPVGSFLAAEKLAAGFKGTPIGTKATALADKLKTEKPVAAEVRARTPLAQVQRLEAVLAGQDGSFNPLDPKFQARNAVPIAQMKQLIEQMRKAHPNTRATEQAEKIGREYGAV